jgi:hypothetical protein
VNIGQDAMPCLMHFSELIMRTPVIYGMFD